MWKTFSVSTRQAMHRYIPGTCLLVADRPQTPVKPDANAPGFLSRLRRLLLPAGREKSLSCLLLAVAIFLFFGHAQNPLHVVFSGEQFYHFSSGLLVLWIPLSVPGIQGGILLFQRLHGRQFPQSERIKVPLRRLTTFNLAGMLFIKLGLFPACQFPILGVNFTGLGVRSNAPLQFGNVFHSLFIHIIKQRCFDLSGRVFLEKSQVESGYMLQHPDFDFVHGIERRHMGAGTSKGHKDCL